MVSQEQVPVEADQQTLRRQERANRILDAAASLILRWGYNKTTVDDIARQARVAKGTIYLHWKTREELFHTLVLRENLCGIEDLRLALAADPQGYALRSVLKHSVLALIKRPVLKALLLQETDVLGTLVRDPQDTGAVAEKIAGFTAYLELLRANGLVRTDMSLQHQTYVLAAAFLGSLLVTPLLPHELRPSDEEMADSVAEMAHRTLASDAPMSAEGPRAVGSAFSTYLAKYEALLRKQFRL